MKKLLFVSAGLLVLCSFSNIKKRAPLQLFEIIENCDVITFGKIVDTLDDYYIIETTDVIKGKCKKKIEVYFSAPVTNNRTSLIGKDVALMLRASQDSYSEYDLFWNSIFFKNEEGYLLNYLTKTPISKNELSTGINLYFESYKRKKKSWEYKALKSQEELEKFGKENKVMNIINKNIIYYLIK